MGNRSWGTPLTITEHILVGDSDEIPTGKKAYVFNQSLHDHPNDVTDPWVWDEYDNDVWSTFMNGDMGIIKSMIETRIPGAQLKWVQVAWSRTRQVRYFSPWGIPYTRTRVYDLKFEAIVENQSGGVTGLEIVAIIAAVAFLVGVIALAVTASWLVWRIEKAAEQLGPVVTIGVGLVILVLVLVVLFTMFGGKAEYKGKKRGFRIGKG
jgi:hypothetical protein